MLLIKVSHCLQEDKKLINTSQTRLHLQNKPGLRIACAELSFNAFSYII